MYLFNFNNSVTSESSDSQDTYNVRVQKWEFLPNPRIKLDNLNSDQSAVDILV